VILGWFGDLRIWTNVLPTNETGLTSSGAGSSRVDLGLAICLRPPNRAEAGVMGEEDEHEEAEEPVMLLSSIVNVEANQSKLVWWPHFGVERSEEAKITMKRFRTLSGSG